MNLKIGTIKIVKLHKKNDLNLLKTIIISRTTHEIN